MEMQLTEGLAKSLQETRELIECAEQECGIGIGMSEGIAEDELRQRLFRRMLDHAEPEQKRMLEQLALLRRQEAYFCRARQQTMELENDIHEELHTAQIALDQFSSMMGPSLEKTLDNIQSVVNQKGEAVEAYFKLRAKLYRMKRDALMAERFTRDEALRLIMNEGREDPIVELLHLQKEMLEACPSTLKR